MVTGRGDQDADALFDGAEQIITMIRELYVRQGPDEHLPLLSLVRPDLDEHPGFLACIRRRLERPETCLPHVYIDLEGGADLLDAPDLGLPEVTQEDVEQVRAILLAVASQLEGRQGGRFRLDRFRVVVWLMSQRLPREEPTHKRHAELRRRLRRRERGSLDQAAQGVAAQSQLPWWVSWFGWAVSGLLTPLWFRARCSGRVPVISGYYRWFLRQPNLAPGDGSFIDLAVKLTADEWPAQVPEQVLEIMVNALLEDLRVAFRGKGFFKKYRTAYPVVLLNRVTRSNGGYSLLRAVNDIRNNTGLLDPMVLVTCSKKMPPHAIEPDRRPARESVFSATDSSVKLGIWKSRIDADKRRRSDVAWYLFILIPDPAEGDARGQLAERLALKPHFAVPHLPVWRNRAVTMGVLIVLLGSAAGWYVAEGLNDSYSSCESGITLPGFQSHNIVRIGEECVGVTDGSNAELVPTGPLFDQARTAILSQNRDAERIHREQPARPLITLVFVGALTPPPSPAQTDPLAAEREQLAGLAVAQRQQLAKAQESDPLLRVLIANAGLKTVHGLRVAGIIGELARLDRSIVAAVGFNETRQATIGMIGALAAAGLPVVAATLSADELAKNKMYFQVSPQNQREAAVVAAYAAQRRDSGLLHNGRRLASKVRIYFSDDPEDIYSKNLAEDAERSFRDKNFAVERVQFTPTGKSSSTPSFRAVPDSKAAGRDACEYDGVIFYAERPLPDFQGFIGGVSDGCKNLPPFVIADDDVTSYVANEDIRKLNTVPFRYISFAVSPEIAGNVDARTRDFYHLLDEMFPAMAKKGHSLDGHAALTYDAAYSAITAAGYLSTGSEKIPVTGGTLWWALASITDDLDAHRKYDGVTGAIDFGGKVSRRFPLNKPISVLQVEGGVPNANEHAFCGSPDDPATQTWCPFDR